MKKFGLFVVLIALVLTACSQYQPPQEKQLTTSDLQNIIVNSPKFEAASRLIKENNLTLNWKNSKLTNPGNLYILRIPTQTTEYAFTAYYDSRNKIVLSTDIVQVKTSINNTIEVSTLDLNSLYLVKYTFDKSGNKLSNEYGRIDSISSLSKIFTGYTRITEAQLYSENLLQTLDNDCNSEISAVHDAYGAMWNARRALAFAIAEEGVAIGLLAECLELTFGIACHWLDLAVIAAGNEIINTGIELERAYDDLEDARAARDACQIGGRRQPQKWRWMVISV